jgi:hypothetical protein
MHSTEEELVAAAEGDQQDPGVIHPLGARKTPRKGDQDDAITYGLTGYLAMKP